MASEAQTCAIGILARILFGRLNNEVRRNSADKATAFHTPQGEKRPCRRTHAGQITVSICVNPCLIFLCALAP